MISNLFVNREYWVVVNYVMVDYNTFWTQLASQSRF